jgi:ABC-type dipeptide/oligopeptide/nickel transport system ATPase component
MAMVLPEPMPSLNPVLKIRASISRPHGDKQGLEVIVIDGKAQAQRKKQRHMWTCGAVKL